jgi:hypothetical protein
VRTITIGVVAAIALSACSGSMNGTIAGSNLAVADAIFYTPKDSAGKTLGLYLVMSDKPQICTSLKANRTAKGSTTLTFLMARVSANGEILAPEVADYTVVESFLNFNSGANSALATFSKVDSNCTEVVASNARGGKSGIVKLTGVKAEANGVASGTYDITVGNGNDKVTGTFAASFCDLSTLPNNPNCE